MPRPRGGRRRTPLNAPTSDDRTASAADQGLRAPPELLRLLADNVPALIAYYEAGGFRCVFANRQYAQSFGFSESSIVGHTFREVIGDAAADAIQPLVDRMLAERVPAQYERGIDSGDGRRRWLEVHLLPHVDGDAVRGAFVLINDITRHRLAEASLRESEERLGKFMQASSEGIVFHKDGAITDANPPILELMGYTLPEMLGRKTLEFIAPDQIAKVSSVIASGQETAYPSVIVHKDGTRIDVEFIVRTMWRNGERLRMTIVRDLRDRHAAEKRIHHLAHHDALTGLPNRLSFNEQLERLMQAARQHGQPLALLFIDLDHFKRVNDSLGHLVGDALLKTVAERIRSRLRTTDLVARFGGDEFMVLLPGVDSRRDVEEVAAKLLAAIGSPVDADGRSISVTPSIGVAVFPADGASSDELIKNADTAMYSAKAQGRAGVAFFDPAIARAAYAALVTESELAEALARDEFVLHFQPQVRAADGVLTGAEALIRWNHPTRGLLGPDAFIPVAERHRLMLAIGRWVLREAARATRAWRAAGVAAVPVAVNLSSVQFETGGFVESVAEVLAEERIDGDWIELELTERMWIDDLPRMKRTLVALKALGLRISIDDFGTGATALRHLTELPIDKIKLDRSFVRGVADDADSAAIARAIIQMAKSLGIGVIAEGVESAAQRDVLAREGCEQLQGSAIGPAMTADDFARWARERAAPSPSPSPTGGRGLG